MPEDFGHAAWGDLPILPNILFQIDHLNLSHRVRAVMPADKRVGRFQSANTITSRMTTDWTRLAGGVKDIAVGEANSR